MTILRAAAAAACALAVALPRPAAAYVRTTSPETGVAVFWPVPIATYDLSTAQAYACCTTASCDSPADAGAIEAAVRASFSEWEQGCTSLRLVFGGAIPEFRTGLAGTAENLVVIRRGWCSNDPVASRDPCMSDPAADCGNLYDCFDDGPSGQNRTTVALTTVLYDPITGRIFDADMEVNGWDGRAAGSTIVAGSTGPSHGYYFTCDRQPGWSQCAGYGATGCYAYDLQNTVTHEAGHFLGLAHPCEDPPSPGVPSCSAPLPPGETVPYAQRTMYPATAIGETSKRVLSADDVAGVCAIYPAPSGCSCGAGGAPGAVALLLAALALRPRVTRRARRRSPPPGACRR